MSTPPARRSRVLPAVLGLILAALGMVFCIAMSRAFIGNLATRSWPATPCLMTKSEVVEFQPVPGVKPSYRLDVEYFYEVDGVTHRGTMVRSRVRTTNDRARAASWRDQFPAGSKSICYPDPANPASAVLERESLAVGYAMFFPALFVIGGAVMTLRALRSPSVPRLGDGMATPRISD